MAILNPGDFPIDPATTTGSDLADRLNRLVAAMDTTQANGTRPANLRAGGLWVQPQTGGGLKLFLFDGTRDLTVATVDAAGAISMGSAGSPPIAPVFDAAKSYGIADLIWQPSSGTYLQAQRALTPGAFNAGDWRSVADVVKAIQAVCLTATGGTLIGPLSVPAGATGNQVPRVNEVVKKSGDTMTGALNVPAGASGTQVPQAQEVVMTTGGTMTGALNFQSGGTTWATIDNNGLLRVQGVIAHNGPLGTDHIGLEGGNAVVARNGANAQIAAMQFPAADTIRAAGTSPTAGTKLQVSGGDGGIMFENVAGQATFSNRIAMGWSGSAIGFRVDSAQIPVGTLSDERVKTNVAPLGSMTDKIKALRPVSFDYKKTDAFPFVADATDRIGFVAQGVQLVIPQAVNAGRPEDMMGIDPMPIIAALVKTVQELEARIAKLEAKP